MSPFTETSEDLLLSSSKDPQVSHLQAVFLWLVGLPPDSMLGFSNAELKLCSILTTETEHYTISNGL